MHNNNSQQYDYSKVHQITPEELQKTLVLNLKDFEETARIERMTSKKPALIVALMGIFSIALGLGFPLIQSFTARTKENETIVENREEYNDEDFKENYNNVNEETVLCNFDRLIEDGTHVISIAELKFRDGGIVAFTRTTTINPIPGNGFGPSSIQTTNTIMQPLLTQMDGYKVTVRPTNEGGTVIETVVDYDRLDFTMFPGKQQTHYATSVDYASNTPKDQVIVDMGTRGFTCA